VTYSFESDPLREGPLGRAVPGTVWPHYARRTGCLVEQTLSRNLGTVRTESLVHSDHADSFQLVYLPAWRNPLDELARREARILVELLRAQKQNTAGSRNLSGLRAKASSLLEQLAKDGLIQAVEERISAHLAALSAGVSRNWPYVRGQVIDDTYLARVLELMLAMLEGREHARPLEVSGLGYVNLLHIAVTLAAVPRSLRRRSRWRRGGRRDRSIRDR
jgi:putative ATP-dependent endonuclease of OLD family